MDGVGVPDGGVPGSKRARPLLFQDSIANVGALYEDWPALSFGSRVVLNDAMMMGDDGRELQEGSVDAQSSIRFGSAESQFGNQRRTAVEAEGAKRLCVKDCRTFVHREPLAPISQELHAEQHACTLETHAHHSRALPPIDVWPGDQHALLRQRSDDRKRERTPTEERGSSSSPSKHGRRADSAGPPVHEPDDDDGAVAGDEWMTAFGRGNGRTISMMVRPSDTGARVLALFLEKERGRTDGVRAVHQSRPLQMHLTLHEQDITRDATIDFFYTINPRLPL